MGVSPAEVWEKCNFNFCDVFYCFFRCGEVRVMTPVPCGEANNKPFMSSIFYKFYKHFLIYVVLINIVLEDLIIETYKDYVYIIVWIIPCCSRQFNQRRSYCWCLSICFSSCYLIDPFEVLHKWNDQHKRRKTFSTEWDIWF